MTWRRREQLRRTLLLLSLWRTGLGILLGMAYCGPPAPSPETPPIHYGAMAGWISVPGRIRDVSGGGGGGRDARYLSSPGFTGPGCSSTDLRGPPTAGGKTTERRQSVVIVLVVRPGGVGRSWNGQWARIFQALGGSYGGGNVYGWPGFDGGWRSDRCGVLPRPVVG